MDGFDLTRTVPALSVSIMGLTMIVLPLIQVFVYLFIRRAYPDGYKGVFLGMASYFIIGKALLPLVYLGEHYIGNQILQGIGSEAVRTAFKNVGQVVSLMIDSAIIVECMEFLYRYFSYQPGTSKFGNALAFGFGFSIVDMLIWLVNTFTNWMMGVSINGIGLESFCENLEGEQLQQFLSDMEPLFSNGPMYYILLFAERILFAAFIFSIISMVQLVSRKLLQRSFMLTIIGIYFCYYLPALLRYMGLIKGDVITVLLLLLITVFVNLFSWQVMKKVDQKETDYLSQIKAEGILRLLFTRRAKNDVKKQTDIGKNANMNTK